MLLGFLIRVQPSGKKSFFVRYRKPADGKISRIWIGPSDALSVAQARDEARKLLGRIALGEDPGADKRAGRTQTLREFLEDTYSDWVEQNTKERLEKVKRVVGAFTPLFDNKLTKIAAWDVEKWRTQRAKEKRPGGQRRTDAAINRSIAYLKAALGKSVDWGLLPENPLRRVKLKSEAGGARVRYLEP